MSKDGRTIKWLTDKGSTAIFEMQTNGGRRVYFYIKGLANDVSGNRSFYNGYWIAPDNGRRICSRRRNFGMNWRSSDWGKLNINFTSKSSPYTWTALLGQCNGRFNERIEAVPIVPAF
jgi:hypothetical protein